MSDVVQNVVNVALFVATAVMAVVAYKQWKGNHKELFIGITQRPIKLFHEALEEYDLQMNFKGQKLDHPYLTIFAIRNVGSRDIVSSDFDGGRPIEVKIDEVKTIWQSNKSRDREGLQPKLSENSEIRFGPELIKRGESWEYMVVTDGQPESELRFQEFLKNVKVRRDLRTRYRRISKRFSKFFEVVSPIAMVLGLASVAYSIWRDGLEEISPIMLLTYGALAGALIFLGVASIILRLTMGRLRKELT